MKKFCDHAKCMKGSKKTKAFQKENTSKTVSIHQKYSGNLEQWKHRWPGKDKRCLMLSLYWKTVQCPPEMLSSFPFLCTGALVGHLCLWSVGWAVSHPETPCSSWGRVCVPHMRWEGRNQTLQRDAQVDLSSDVWNPASFSDPSGMHAAAVSVTVSPASVRYLHQLIHLQTSDLRYQVPEFFFDDDETHHQAWGWCCLCLDTPGPPPASCWLYLALTGQVV